MQSAKELSDLGRRWRPVLLAYFLRRVRNHAEAEDLTQEMLAKLVALDGSALESPEAYIFQMASNLLADRARRFKVRTQFLEIIGRADDVGIDPIDPFRIVAGRTELERLEVAIGSLPDRTRTIFILFRLENLAQDRIADAYGISTRAVKRHVARAMAYLMKEMRDAP
jgi:RNA polymerase sigma factor (sigma-70 family)